MKKIKNIILKGIIAGMTMATGIGAIAPAMANMSVYAAENESSEVVKYYEKITYKQATEKVDAAKEKGTVLSENDNVTRIEINGDVYRYTVIIKGTEHQEKYSYYEDGEEMSFSDEEEAYQYAVDNGWDHINVWQDYYLNYPVYEEWWVVEGDVTWASLTVEKETATSISSSNMTAKQAELQLNQELCM